MGAYPVTRMKEYQWCGSRVRLLLPRYLPMTVEPYDEITAGSIFEIVDVNHLGSPQAMFRESVDKLTYWRLSFMPYLEGEEWELVR